MVGAVSVFVNCGGGSGVGRIGAGGVSGGLTSGGVAFLSTVRMEAAESVIRLLLVTMLRGEMRRSEIRNMIQCCLVAAAAAPTAVALYTNRCTSQ